MPQVPYIPMLKEGNPRKGFFEHAEFEALRKNLPDYLKGYVTFGYVLGWRKDEISSLTWAQVDQRNWVIYMNRGESKNDEPGTYYLDNEYFGELRDIFEAQ